MHSQYKSSKASRKAAPSNEDTPTPPPDLSLGDKFYGVFKGLPGKTGVYTTWYGEEGAEKAIQGLDSKAWDLCGFEKYEDAVLYSQMGRKKWEHHMKEVERKARGERTFISSQELQEMAKSQDDGMASMTSTLSQVALSPARKTQHAKSAVSNAKTSSSHMVVEPTFWAESPNVSIHVQGDLNLGVGGPKKVKGKGKVERPAFLVGYWTRRAATLTGWGEEFLDSIQEIAAEATNVKDLRVRVEDMFEEGEGLDEAVDVLVSFIQLDGWGAAPHF